MVEPLRDLNAICQKPNYKTVGNWMVRHILRDAALPVTWLLLHTPVSAHQVTTIALITGLFGSVLLGFPGSFFLGSSVIALQLWYLLDHVDGQIARYRKTASLSGRFYDFIMHHLIHAAAFFFLSLSTFLTTGSVFYLILGFFLSLSALTLNLIHDVKYKTFFEALEKNDGSMVHLKHSDVPGTVSSKKKNLFVSSLHKLSEMHVFMNLLTAGALAECFFLPTLNVRHFLFLFYAVSLPVLAAAKIYFWISRSKVDREFAYRFKNASEHS